MLGDATKIDVQTPFEVFLNMSLRSACYIAKFLDLGLFLSTADM